MKKIIKFLLLLISFITLDKLLKYCLFSLLIFFENNRLADNSWITKSYFDVIFILLMNFIFFFIYLKFNKKEKITIIVIYIITIAYYIFQLNFYFNKNGIHSYKQIECGCDNSIIIDEIEWSKK